MRIIARANSIKWVLALSGTLMAVSVNPVLATQCTRETITESACLGWIASESQTQTRAIDKWQKAVAKKYGKEWSEWMRAIKVEDPPKCTQDTASKQICCTASASPCKP